MSDEESKKVNNLKFDEIGYWSEIKLEIVKKYAKAYSTILATKRLKYAYVDGFAGTGVHLSKTSGEFVLGSPLNALQIHPPFHDYYLIDLDGDKVNQLQKFPEISGKHNVHVIQGDCNNVLLEKVFPNVKYENYCRALCVLDPYGLHLNWNVIERAGKMQSIEIFLNFPVMDMNRNVLWRRPEMASESDRCRMTAFWGDTSWNDAAYKKQLNLLGEYEDFKQGNHAVAQAFADRLKRVAGFSYVPSPLPMRNSSNAIVYYLIFASQQPVAAGIVESIMSKYKNRGL